MRYILQHDLPDCKAGTIYTITEDGRCYVANRDSGATWGLTYPIEVVENNPDWFKPENTISIELNEFTLKDMRKCFESARVGGTNHGYQYTFFEDFIREQYRKE